jgi:hypothetical protein
MTGMSAAREPLRDPSQPPSSGSGPGRDTGAALKRRPWRGWLLGLGVAWLLAGAYVFPRLDRNWEPSDDGLLAQAAERVLLGQVPHRDFTEVYTGGLDYLNALGFRVFGLYLMAPRYVLFGFILAWVPVVYYCASRFLGPIGAVVIALLAVVWSVPNYPAAMPSWYNLFFATFGTAALLRFAEVGGRRWLFLAGLMGGCSLLAKIAGLYFVAAGLLFLLVHEGMTQRTHDHPHEGRVYRWLIGLGLLGFVGALIILLRRHLVVENVYHFLVPGVGLALLTWHVSAGAGALPSSRRFQRLWAFSWPFLLGLAIPIAAFVAPNFGAGGIGALLHGVFVRPTTRLTGVSRSAVEWPAVIPAAILAALLVVAVRSGRGIRTWGTAIVWAVLFPAAAAIGGAEYLYRISWASVSQAIPLVVVAGFVVLARRLNHKGGDAVRWEQSFLLLAVAGLSSLIEFPYSAPVYFCYTAPLALLALIAVLHWVGDPPQPLAGVLVAYYAVFAIVVLNSQSTAELGLTATHGQPLARLELPRGGVRVRARDAAEYRAVVDTLTAHAQGSYTYAGPDAPEIYFLAGLRNPTPTFFDFLEPSEGSADRVLSAVDRHGVTAVVINRFVKFSDKLSPELEAGFARRFPHEATVGRFTVRWQ